jgi:iron complex transport system permease protein
MQPSVYLIPALVVLSVVALGLSLVTGSLALSWTDVIAALTEATDSVEHTVVWELRLPRALTAFVVGGLLALSGALMQVLLRNPLADPYILGVSGGAAVAALLCISLGLSGFWISGSAFCGALLSMLLVFSLAHGRGGWSTLRLLLTGVVVAAGWGAAVSLLLALSPDNRVHSMLFWLMGDLAGSRMPGTSFLVLLLGLAVCLAVARHLNILARGDLQARSLGVPVQPLRLMLYFLASLLAATAVTLAGSVGFVGLVVPHMLRLLGAGDHRLLLPASVLLGGSLLMISDTVGRTLIAPQQLPVGVITAMIGVPVYLFILNRGARSL